MEGMRLKTLVVLVLLAAQFFGYSEEGGQRRALMAPPSAGVPSGPSIPCDQSCWCPSCSNDVGAPAEASANLHN
ncbi:hypothetical protein QJS10_CPA10g01482 [Acorus calamus]|uniref:Uncharacterized protein n=1 Tax=Acorus calamus TaxID=4465 RepID=A0AAV9DX88_ACOCL|nr:hypothetical protein QJS10_CPA10g01482 [Acorus calamus]